MDVTGCANREVIRAARWKDPHPAAMMQVDQCESEKELVLAEQRKLPLSMRVAAWHHYSRPSIHISTDLILMVQKHRSMNLGKPTGQLLAAKANWQVKLPFKKCKSGMGLSYATAVLA